MLRSSLRFLTYSSAPLLVLSGCGGKFVEDVDEDVWRDNGTNRRTGATDSRDEPIPGVNPEPPSVVPGSPGVPSENLNPPGNGLGLYLGQPTPYDAAAEPGSCANPIPLQESEITEFSNTTAQRDLFSSFSSSCGGNGNEAVHYFVAPSSGHYVFDTRYTSFDAVLSLTTEPCGGLEIMCNDDTYDLDSQVNVYMDAGEAVYITVDALDRVFGEYNLNGYLSSVDAPECGGEQLGASLGTPLVVKTIAAPPRNNYPSGSCGAGATVASFTWTALNEGRYSFDLTGSDFDTVLSARLDCDGLLECNDDHTDVTSYFELDVGQGQTLILDVALFGEGDLEPGTPMNLVLSIAER